MEEDNKSSQEVLDKNISPEKVSDASFKPLHWQQLEKGLPDGKRGASWGSNISYHTEQDSADSSMKQA